MIWIVKTRKDYHQHYDIHDTMEIPDKLVRDMDVNNLLINDGRVSVYAKGKQETIERYAKDVMKRLYDEDIYVFFCSFKGTLFEELMAMFRGMEFPPLNETDKKVWEQDKKPSITFNTEHFKQDEIPTDTWIVIIHEATHYEVSMKVIKNKDSWHVDDDETMNRIVMKNGRKVAKLGRKFLKEVGLKIEDIYQN